MSFDRRKVRVGTVVSDKMDKTVSVEVQRRRAHPLYGKVIRHRTQFKAHDEENNCRVGDLVRIMEVRPLSRTKRWRVVEIMARQEIAETQPQDIVVDESVAVATAARDSAEAVTAEAAVTVAASEETAEAAEEEDAPVAEAVAQETAAEDEDAPQAEATAEGTAEAEEEAPPAEAPVEETAEAKEEGPEAEGTDSGDGPDTDVDKEG
jgi:small subunit ribosomal protein S17